MARTIWKYTLTKQEQQLWDCEDMRGWRAAMRENPEILRGANVVLGRVTYQGVAEAFDLPFEPVYDLLN